MADEDNNKPAPDDDDKTQIATPAAADDRTEIAPRPVPTAPPEPAVETEPPTVISVPPAPMPEPSAPPTEPESPGQATPVPIGTLINNNYEIKKLINAGGMGEVFRGENVFTGDAVAIKIVLQSLAHDEKVAALFMREAKVLCQLSDQAIVRYYNFVRDADLDRFCLIMEFIEGIALSDYIRDVAPLTLEQTVGLMRRVAAGLDRAHQMEVIHRDLSPDNVMLRDGSVDNAVLIDFGIAKSAEMAESTLHGQLAGKFKYISPEQLGHFGGEIGPRTDIYGLGLMMAAALRGSPLDMGNSVVEAVNARREIPELDGVDEALRPLLSYMLEPDPAHRPARMSDVIALLDDPSGIPAKYGSARPLAGAPATTPPADVPGLRQPPVAAQTTGGFGGQITDPGSASPFGETTGLPSPPPPTEDSDSGGGFLRWVFVLLIFGAIGGFFAWQQGLLGGVIEEARTPIEAPEEPASSIGSLDPSTREGFLATWSDLACVFATRITGGPNSGTIAAFASQEGAFEGLIDAYEAAFDARPASLEFLVSPEQCPALELAKAMRQPQSAPALLTLDSTVMESGGSIVGRISDRRGRSVWLAFISTQGGVYNLTDRLTEQADGSATFSIGLLAEDGSGPQPQLIVALVSDQPPIAVGAAQDGRSAASLLPLIETEFLGRDDSRAGFTIIGFELRP